MLSGSRFSGYLLLSTALVLALVSHTYSVRRQFYPTVLSLSSNKLSLLLLTNEALGLTLLLGKLGVRLFFGRLREAEIEHLYERAW